MSSHFLILLVIANLYGYRCVDGASCTTSSTCQATDYTLSTCTSNVCNCINSSYTVVRTGCALKPEKPVITTDAGMSNQVVKGQSFKLTCNLADADTFEWYQGTTKLGTTTALYTATANSVTDVGSFTCKGTTSETLLTSATSDAFIVEMLGTGGVTSSTIQPTISVPTTTVITGSSVEISCTNVPMGSVNTISYNYKVDGAVVPNPVTIDNTNTGKEVTCTIAAGSGYTFSTGTSAVGKLPTLITNIQSVAVTWKGQTLTDIEKSSGSLQLECTLNPGFDYLGKFPGITYVWQKDGSAITDATRDALTVTYSGTYSCTATLSGETAVASGNKVEVAYRNEGLDSSSTLPIKGGRVILTCGTVRYESVTYHWLKDSKIIGRQYDRKLQIDNFDTSDDGIYQCKILLNGAVLETYGPARLTTQTTINQPTIYPGGCGNRFGEKGDYFLSCETSSETIGMTYEWTFNGIVSTSVTGKYYSLSSISTSNNGDYTCKARFGAYNSSVSIKKTVEVTDPGMLCPHDNTCIAASTGYSGKCDLNDRCLCADGYSQKGEVCSDGILAAVSSTVIIAVAYLVSRII